MPGKDDEEKGRSMENVSNHGKLNINEWSEEDRPRERLARLGASALSNAELLAILIGSGTPDLTAVDLMKQVLKQCGDNLNTLGKMSIDELTTFHGIGPAKAITILAACELGKRRQAESVADRQDFSSPDLIYQFMRPKMQDLDVEEAWIMMLNQKCKLIKCERLSHGGISETSVDLRLIIKQCVLNNATILVLCHNHPSNSPKPSPEDDQLTQRVKRGCDIMRIHFLDHLIITDGKYYSYREQGRL